MDGRAWIDAGSERREREMKLGFDFILGGAVIGLERPGGYVCVREKKREKRDIYKMVGVLSLVRFIAVVKRQEVFTESILLKRIKDSTTYIPIIYIYPPIYPSINFQQQLLLLNQPQQQRSKSTQVKMKASLSTLLFLATAAGLAQAAAATENLVARGK